MDPQRRVAVYFSGHIRNFKENIANFRRVFQHPNVTFDYYFTFWRVNHNAMNDSWRHNNRTNKKLVDIAHITEADVYEICPEAKKVVILHEFELPEEYAPYKPSAVFQAYSLYKAFQELPDTYDLYVRMRPDIYFFNGVDWGYILNSRDTHDLFISETVHFKLKNYPSGDIFDDLFWVSNYTAGKYLSNLFTSITSMNGGRAMEHYFATHLSNNNYRIAYHPFDIALERRTRGFDADLEETPVYTRRRKEEGDFI